MLVHIRVNRNDELIHLHFICNEDVCIIYFTVEEIFCDEIFFTKLAKD